MSHLDGSWCAYDVADKTDLPTLVRGRHGDTTIGLGTRMYFSFCWFAMLVYVYRAMLL